MKIILYNPLGATQGHAQDYVDNICDGLIFHDINLSLVTTSNFELSRGLSQFVEVLHTRELSETFGEGRSFVQTIKYGYWLIRSVTDSILFLWKVIKRESPDVCMFIGGSSLLNALVLPFFIANFRNTLFTLTLHNVDLDWKIYRGFSVKKIYKLLQAHATRRLAKSDMLLHCHGEFMMNKLKNVLKVENSNICYYPVPNIGVKSFYGPIEELKNDSPILLFFGVIRVDKGLDILCSALAKMISKKWKLIIAGSAQQVGTNYVYECIKKLPSNRVVLDLRYFSSDERDDYYRKSSIICLPYRKTFMAQSVVMVDAMRLHKPVITTTCSENGSNTQKYGVGWTCESENVSDLSRAIDEALKGYNYIESKHFINFNEDHEPRAVGAQILKTIKEHQ